MTIAISRESFASVAAPNEGAWRRNGSVLAAVALVLLALFASDTADLARLWWTSTTFGHCLFIGPVVAWLVWQRRAELAQLRPVAWPP
ncbi:MAG: archaeosortase/exosortase family protein, partial [Sphingomonas sp.]|nr:archaeosortase/exosortase family protein [Sphingomonas sp.]